MISISNVSVHFGSFSLFKSINFLITPRDRIGLVGKNGAGKSTLMKMISGEESPSEGTIAMPKDITLGYLPQQPNFADGKTVIQETMLAFERINKLKTQLEGVNDQIAERTDYESDSYMKLIERVSDLSHQLEVLGGSNTRGLTEQTLLGLGFTHTDFVRQTNEFSGGWRMRIEIAKLLLKRPDVLLLDEPTNHLDIESIQWLEDFLKAYPGAVLLISHDRAFLDNITKRTIEISVGRIFDYKAAYTTYVELRKERREQQMAAYVNQQKMITETEDFIERFRYKATKAVQVQSRIKQLEKLDRIEVDEEDNASVHFKFPPAPRSGTIVMEAKGYTKRYGDLLVLEDVDRIMERGDKIALIGKNGEGKTTFARSIIGELEHEGIMKLGHNVEIGYFAQNSDKLLDESRTVYQTLDDIAVGEVRTKVRDILGSFLFSGETIDKKVQVLSGGERSRLALAKLLLQPYSMLLLDEPTNHLDMRSKDILKQALMQYDGSLIIISHDRDFLDGLVGKLIEFKDKGTKEHAGSVYQFLKQKKADEEKQKLRRKAEPKAEKQSTLDNKALYARRKEQEKELRKVRSSLSKLEADIENLEAQIVADEEKMSLPENASDTDLFKNYTTKKTKLEQTMYEWEVTGLRIDEMESDRL